MPAAADSDTPIHDKSGSALLTPLPADLRILILNPIRFSRDALRSIVHGAVVTATIVVAGSLAEAAQRLDDQPFDLLVTDVAMGDGDVLDLLPGWMQRDRRVGRVFIASSHTGPHILETLRRYPIRGFFDETTDSTEAFGRALQQVVIGGSYWSPSIAPSMIAGEPAGSVWSTLTLAEKAVLAAVGTGIDDKAAAVALKLSVSTIRDVRERLHRKLGVQQRSELMHAASSLGCVVFAEGHILRLGYRTLLENYQIHARRR